MRICTIPCPHYSTCCFTPTRQDGTAYEQQWWFKISFLFAWSIVDLTPGLWRPTWCWRHHHHHPDNYHHHIQQPKLTTQPAATQNASLPDPTVLQYYEKRLLPKPTEIESIHSQQPRNERRQHHCLGITISTGFRTYPCIILTWRQVARWAE